MNRVTGPVRKGIFKTNLLPSNLTFLNSRSRSTYKTGPVLVERWVWPQGVIRPVSKRRGPRNYHWRRKTMVLLWGTRGKVGQEWYPLLGRCFTIVSTTDEEEYRNLRTIRVVIAEIWGVVPERKTFPKSGRPGQTHLKLSNLESSITTTYPDSKIF